MDFLSDLIAHNVAIKARVVAADPFEKGERAHLNFGHTFAHAIEAASHHTILHGEAVALGMLAAADASLKLGMLDAASRDRIRGIIRRAALPTGGISMSIDAVLEAMRADKKIASGRARFVLLEGIGRAVMRDDVPESLVRDAVDQLRK
jgi:3-dehydroquinate synthetase